jgi:hypothetical protein
MRSVKWIFRTILWLAFAVKPCVAHESEGDSENTLTTCVEELQIPRAGPPGNIGDRIGPILVRFLVDSNGRAKSLVIVGGSSGSTALLSSWLAESRFAAVCAGRTLTLQFSFLREGPPIDYPFSWVSFQSPNHFVVHTRARTQSVFTLPDKKESK